MSLSHSDLGSAFLQGGQHGRAAACPASKACCPFSQLPPRPGAAPAVQTGKPRPQLTAKSSAPRLVAGDSLEPEPCTRCHCTCCLSVPGGPACPTTTRSALGSGSNLKPQQHSRKTSAELSQHPRCWFHRGKDSEYSRHRLRAWPSGALDGAKSAGHSVV